MSETKQLSCGVCHAYLFDDDDVVYCPVCGAPHHRDCYKSIGHCAYEEAHGTENQYKKPEFFDENTAEDNSSPTVTCDICGKTFKQDERQCTNCGAPNFKSTPSFANFDFLGGVPESEDLGGGVTAAEARRFVFTNTRRYIPKFAQIKSGKKASWNWFAFLFPSAWFLSRKMYIPGIITGILSICFSMFLLPFGQVLSQYDTSSVTTYSELAQMIAADMPNISASVLYLCSAGVILQILLRVLSGILGDNIYRNHAIDAICNIKKDSDDIDYDYRKKGGTNFFLFLLGFLAVQYIPNIIFSLIIQ